MAARCPARIARSSLCCAGINISPHHTTPLSIMFRLFPLPTLQNTVNEASEIPIDNDYSAPPALQFYLLVRQSGNTMLFPLKSDWDDTVWKRSIEFMSSQSSHVATDMGEQYSRVCLRNGIPSIVISISL
jgi:hypothetical protein